MGGGFNVMCPLLYIFLLTSSLYSIKDCLRKMENKADKDEPQVLLLFTNVPLVTYWALEILKQGSHCVRMCSRDIEARFTLC